MWLNFENFKTCLEGTRLENKIKHLEKNQVDINRIKENYE